MKNGLIIFVSICVLANIIFGGVIIYIECQINKTNKTSLMKLLIAKLKKIWRLFSSKSLPYFFTRKTMIDFCIWSKQAEWQNGERKTSFMQNDFETYVKLFLEERTNNKN